MKHLKVYTLLALMAIVSMAKGQDYLPLVKDNAEWNIVWKATSQWTWLRITENLQLEGDTMVDDMHYKKVMRKISSETNYWHGSTEYYSLYGLIREEPEGKVFYQPIDQDTVYLLYDFNMNVNDTVVMSWCQLPNWDVTIRIDSITTQYIAGMDRRVFYVSSKSTNAPNEEWHWLNTWIEGIGATEGLLYSCHVTAAGGITLHELLCYHENGDLMYMNPDYDTCFVDTYHTPVEFAPVGAEWYYQRLYREGWNFTGVTYDRFRSLRTLEINGWECKEIELYQHLDDYGVENPHTELYYINQEGNQIYEVDGGVRYLLYNFDIEPGAGWYAPKYNLSVYVIDTSTMVLEDGSVRKVLHTFLQGDYDDYWYFDNIIEGIGLDKSIFPFLELDGPPQSMHDYIRCYSEDGVPLIVSEEEECDHEILAVDELSDVVKLYPNPANSVVHIEGIVADEVQVYNSLGQLVKTVQGTNHICVEGLPKGIYMLRITDAEGKNHMARVAVKE